MDRQKEQHAGPSDEHIIGRLQETRELERRFPATRAGDFEQLRSLIHSRGDVFDRDGILVFEQAGRCALEVFIRDLPITIGRAEEADHTLKGDGISREHCRLEAIGQLVRLCDLGSTNGTRLNGERIDWEDLCDGDRVQIGSVEWIVRRG